MRTMLHTQTPLVYQPGDHVQSRELATISSLLDSESGIVRLVHEALVASGAKPGTGRDAPTAEQVLRCLVIKMTYGFSYSITDPRPSMAPRPSPPPESCSRSRPRDRARIRLRCQARTLARMRRIPVDLAPPMANPLVLGGPLVASLLGVTRVT
mgnify:CR=1 FL=1